MAGNQKFLNSENSLETGSKRTTQNPAGVDFGTPDPWLPLTSGEGGRGASTPWKDLNW